MKTVKLLFQSQADTAVNIIPILGGKVVVGQDNFIASVADPVHKRENLLVPS